MSATISASAPTALRDSYRVLTAGPGAFGDGSGLRELLCAFFAFRGGVIDSLNLHYDGPEHLAKGGR